MITELTKEQIDKFSEYVKKWTDIGLSTQPSDRPSAEKAIKEMYKVSNLDEPKIVWCDSPISAVLTIAIIGEFSKEKMASVGASVRTSVWASVWDSVVDSVWDSVGASVRDSIGSSIWSSVRTSVGDSVWDSVCSSVWASVWDSVLGSVLGSVGASVRASILDSVGDSVWDSVCSSVWASILDSVGDSVWDSVCSSVWASVWDSVLGSVLGSVGASVRDSVLGSIRNSIEGSHLSHLSAFYLFFRDECGLKEETENGLSLYELTQSCGWIFPYKNICFASERHCKLNRDEQGRIHCQTDAAIEYPDGWKIYAIHGVRVPEYVIMNPEKITVELIEKEENVEVKRIMIARYKKGYESYIKDSGSELIDEQADIHSGLPVKLWRKKRNNDTDIVMVEMLNKTKEPDDNGNMVHKSYYIRVKPDITDSLDAIAWHHNLSKKEYLKTQKGT